MKDASLKINPQLGFLNNIEWMNAPASEIFISVNDRNHPELPVLSASQEWGMIYRDEGGMNIFHDVANEVTYKRVKPGQFVIHLRSFQGGFAHSKVEGITSPAYTILDFKDKNKHNDLFWKYVLTSEEFIKRLELITYGIRDGRSINFSDFSTLKFQFPSYEAQQKIGSFLSNIDSLIQAKTKKLESLKAVKKSLLQKSFPKAGKKIPEMRFTGFSGDWEEKKLTDEITLYSGLTYTPKNVCEYGTLVLRSSNVQNGEINLEDQVRVKTEVVNSQNVEKGDIIVVVRNGSKALIGKHAQIKSEMDNTVIGAFMAGIKSKQPEFMNALLSSEKFDHEVEINLGATINQITNSTFDKMFFYFPSTEEEQQKIGQFFSKYDSLISAQQKEIDKLKDIKKSLLQKMFV